MASKLKPRGTSYSSPSSNTIRRLRSLNLLGRRCLTLTDDEDKQMAALLQKSYAIESLTDINLEFKAGNVGVILRLNQAGRRYLIEDGSSISKVVRVLSAVSYEIASDTGSTDNSGGSATTVNPIGKREHGRAQTEGTEGK
jgi:hypothetical protein